MSTGRRLQVHTPVSGLHGKGAACRGRLYINEKLVGQVEMPVAIPIMIGLGERQPDAFGG